MSTFPRLINNKAHSLVFHALLLLGFPAASGGSLNTRVLTEASHTCRQGTIPDINIAWQFPSLSPDNWFRPHLGLPVKEMRFIQGFILQKQLNWIHIWYDKVYSKAKLLRQFSIHLNMLKSGHDFKEETMTCGYITEREVTLLLWADTENKEE